MWVWILSWDHQSQLGGSGGDCAWLMQPCESAASEARSDHERTETPNQRSSGRGDRGET